MIAVILLLGLGTALWISQDEDEPFLWSREFGQMKADLVLSNVDYKRSEKDKGLVWDITADVTRFFEEQETVHFDRPVILIHSDGDVIRIVADKGRYLMKQGDMEVEGHVKVVSPDGYLLQTRSMRFLQKEQVVKTSDRALLLGDNGVELQGDGFVYYLEDRRLVMKKPVALIPEEEAGV